MTEDKVTVMLNGLRDRLTALVAEVRQAREDLAQEMGSEVKS